MQSETRCPECGELTSQSGSHCPQCGEVLRPTVEWDPRGDASGIGRVIADRYLLTAYLGTGGSGVVFKATDQLLDRNVAIKLLQPGADLTRFRREVSIAQDLNHPGIVRVYDIGSGGGHDYFTMEWVDGESLAQRMRNETLEVDEIRRLLLEVSDALGHLHSHGILHRDIKPANILVESRSGRPRLTDFGLAKPSHDVESRHSTVAGTPHYMPPEQLLGQTLDERADLYALGATFYEALVGSPPYEGASIADIASQKQRSRPVPIRKKRPQVPENLTTTLESCLDPDVRLRPGSVTELRRRLESDKPVRVPLLRRRRFTTAVVVAAVIALVTAAGLWALPSATDVHHQGAQVLGTNAWGRTVWRRDVPLGEGEQVRTAKFRDVGEARFSVVLAEPHEDGDWIRDTLILDRRGRTVLDTTALEPRIAPYYDPRREFSGILSCDVMRWSSTADTIGDDVPIFLKRTNLPWYTTVSTLCAVGNACPATGFANPGRVYSIAFTPGGPPRRYALLVGNSELLHMSALAIFEERLRGHAPPRMVDQPDASSSLVSYTLLPLDYTDFASDALRPMDGGWEVCTRSGTCERLDADGNRAGEKASTRIERMAFFEVLSQIDASRRASALAVAEEQYRTLEASPPVDPLEAAALYWVGARVAAARGAVDDVVARTQRAEESWSTTTDGPLLRATVHILAGRYDEADRDLHTAQARRGARSDNVRTLHAAGAWLRGDHEAAQQVVEEIMYPYERARWRGLLLLADGRPEEALAELDPWADHPIRESIEQYRAMALLELGRVDEARRALRHEVDRHGWRRDDVDWIMLAADLREGKPVSDERVQEVLERARRRAETDIESRLLLPYAQARLNVPSRTPLR